jgi:hypothetical protein
MTATNEEFFVIVGIAVVLAVLVFTWQRPPPIEAPAPAPPPPKESKPADWHLGGTTPGWTSGRWLGEGDFVHKDRMIHPFIQGPRM